MKTQFFILSIMFLLLPSFAFATTFSVTPAFVPDPSYPSGTTLSTVVQNPGERWTSFDTDTGIWDNGGDLGSVGSWTWKGEFNNDNTGKHTLVEYTTHPGSCYGTDLATCLAGGTVVATFDVCLTDNTECAGGGGGGGGSFTTGPEEVFPGYGASTTFMIVNNPNQDMSNALFLFLSGFAIIIWLFKGRK